MIFVDKRSFQFQVKTTCLNVCFIEYENLLFYSMFNVSVEIGGRGRRHKSQLNGDWYLHKLFPVLVCPQSQCAQPHGNHRTSAQLSIMTLSNIWANHSNKPRTILGETTARQWPRSALGWTTPDGCSVSPIHHYQLAQAVSPLSSI